ncbi:Hsp70 protein [Stackebrandtia endophytica]|uniref:Hsp70 protein n=1 Tax=Stackebrandtia endophytica TaxID=1496996 RepID=A0A543B365_9ACTN|nr:Hsp70 family protein [Stackebrandtia endophytica]TQL79242.1 Hsp70 protein [Stackebrandtia endophytica]
MSGAPDLGVDFGTSHTVAVLNTGGSVTPLLFDGSPLLPSDVYAESDGTLLTGRDAQQAARSEPASCEPHPKRRIDDGSVLLGQLDIGVVDLFTAVLSRVRDEAVRVVGRIPDNVTVTHPASWGAPRRKVLSDAADRAGLGTVRLVPEPVVAAQYFVVVAGHRVPVGTSAIVADFGGGTFDATLVRRTESGFDVRAVVGRDDLGGVDLDDAIARHLAQRSGHSVDWTGLLHPSTARDHRARRAWYDEVRLAKERLSRHSMAELYIAPADRSVHLTRDEVETLADPLLAPALTLITDLIGHDPVSAVFLVGGGSRIPLVATRLHQALRRSGLDLSPTILEQPELVVAQGGALPPSAVEAPTGDLAVSDTPTAAQLVPDLSPPPIDDSPFLSEPPDPTEVDLTPPGFVDEPITGPPITTGVSIPEPVRGRSRVLARIGPLLVVVVIVAVVGLILNLPTGDAEESGDGTATTTEAADPGSDVTYFPEHGGLVTDLAVGLTTPGWDMLLSAGEDAVVRVEQLADAMYEPGPHTGHRAGVTAIALGDIGGAQHALSGDADGLIQIWEPASKMTLYEFAEHDGAILDIATTPGGTAISVDDASGVPVVWDIAGQERQRELSGLSDKVTALTTAPGGDGYLVAGADTGGRIAVWDVGSGDLVYEHLAASGQARAIDLAELDGRPVMVVAPQDGVPYLWDLESEQSLGGFDTTDTGSIQLFDWNGRLLVAAGGSGGFVRVWDAATTSPVAELDLEQPDAEPIPALQLLKTADGLVVYAAIGNRVAAAPVEVD